MKMEEEIKRWTAKRKSALVMHIIQGKTTVAEASRARDLTPSESGAGWTTPSGALRAPCGPNPRRCTNNTNGNCVM